ncbi:hypothetical protein [Phenylobacterium sp.]|uniref:hypothetical protein n=1 Tax=Phenylobacterium sp. TaxID=1871053 RepID=UPI0025EE86A2|nr:hypothetical protein [Phenylobacterium sp.]
MTQGKLPQRGWIAGGLRLRVVLFEACLRRSKRLRHKLTPELLDTAKDAVRAALERYGEKRVRTPYVTATEQQRRLRKIAVAARRLAASPKNAKWRERLVAATDPLFLRDPSTADFANHVLVQFEAELGLVKARGLPQFVRTLKSRRPLGVNDVGRCRALAAVESRKWGPDSKRRYLAKQISNDAPVRDPHEPDVRDQYLIELIRDLESVWFDLTGKGVLAEDPVDKRVYFADWLSLVVRKATRGRLRILPGTVIDAAEALRKSKTKAGVAMVTPV